MKLERLITILFGLVIGCSSHPRIITNNGWIEYYPKGKIIEMKDDNIERNFFCRLSITDSKYSVEGLGKTRLDAELKAENYLWKMYSLGIYPYFLKFVDNGDKIINEDEMRRYSSMVYFIK